MSSGRKPIIYQGRECPDCGCQRVATDCDDEFYLAPGRVMHTTGCGHKQVFRNERSHFWQDVWHLAEEAAKQPCPDCGGALSAGVGRCTYFTSETHAVCCDRQTVERLPGCPKCCESHVWIGGGLAVAD